MLPSPSARSNSTQIRTAAPGQSRFYSSIRYRTLVLINPACLQHNSQILPCGTAIMLIEHYQGSRLSLAPFKHDSYVLTRAHISPPLPACLWILTTVGLKQFIARIVGPFAKCGVLAYILLSEGDPEVDNRSESCPTANGPEHSARPSVGRICLAGSCTRVDLRLRQARQRGRIVARIQTLESLYLLARMDVRDRMSNKKTCRLSATSMAK
jgi:hypothetical protein